MLQRPEEAYAVCRVLARRRARVPQLVPEPPGSVPSHTRGFDTQDHELDIGSVGRPVEWKDDELLDVRVREGRFTEDQVRGFRAEARRLEAELATRGHWWDASWALWEPDPAWDDPA